MVLLFKKISIFDEHGADNRQRLFALFTGKFVNAAGQDPRFRRADIIGVLPVIMGRKADIHGRVLVQHFKKFMDGDPKALGNFFVLVDGRRDRFSGARVFFVFKERNIGIGQLAGGG